MKKYLLIALIASGFSATAQQTPTSRTRSANDYSQVDNYLTGLKRLGIPTSSTDNLDAPGLPQNTVKILFNTTLGKLRVYNPVAGTWADATAVDLAGYMPLTGGTTTGPITVNHSNGSSMVYTSENIESSTGAYIRNAGGIELHSSPGTKFDAWIGDYRPINITPYGINLDGTLNVSGESHLNGNIISTANGNIFRYQHNADGLLIGGYIGGENFNALQITNNGTQHFKSLIAPTDGDDIARLGDVLPRSGGEVSGNTTFASGLYGYGPVDIWTGQNSARLSLANSMARLQHKNPDGAGIAELGAYTSGNNGQVQLIAGSSHGQMAINIESPEPENKGIKITNQVNGKGIQYTNDSDWENITDLGLTPKKYVDGNFFKKGQDLDLEGFIIKGVSDSGNWSFGRNSGSGKFSFDFANDVINFNGGLKLTNSLEIGSGISTGGGVTSSSFNIPVNLIGSYPMLGFHSTGYGKHAGISYSPEGLRFWIKGATPETVTSTGINPLNISDDGNIGVSGDVVVTDATKGIVLKSPSGNIFRVTVSDTGVLTATAL